MTKPKIIHFVVQYRSRYRGKPRDFEIDAVSASDAMSAFMAAAYSGRLSYKFHSVVGIKVKEENK